MWHYRQGSKFHYKKTLIKAKLNKSDDKHRVAANITKYHIVSKSNLPKNYQFKTNMMIRQKIMR